MSILSPHVEADDVTPTRLDGVSPPIVTDASLPWGAKEEETSLFKILNATRDFHAELHATDPDCICEPWYLVKMVAIMPITDEAAAPILGYYSTDSFVKECVDEVRKIKGLPSLRPTFKPATDEEINEAFGF